MAIIGSHLGEQEFSFECNIVLLFDLAAAVKPVQSFSHSLSAPPEEVKYMIVWAPDARKLAFAFLSRHDYIIKIACLSAHTKGERQVRPSHACPTVSTVQAKGNSAVTSAMVRPP